MQEQERQVLTIENQKRFSMSGVLSVDGFTERSLRLGLTSGKVTVTGEDIKIVAFNKETGNLQAEGTFFGVQYSAGKKPFFKRIFS